MQTTNRFLDDLAKVANSAVSTLGGVKGEVEAMIRQQMDKMLVEMDVVPRDEFDAVKAMAAKARSEQEKLEKRVAKLEAALAKKAAPKAKATAKKTTTKTKSDKGAADN
jgi:BMFP domain-containing protein YqiC